MLAVVVIGANEDSRAELEARVVGIDGFVALPRDTELKDADIVMVVTDRDGFGVTRRIASRAAAQPPMLLVVDEPFEELVSVMWLGVHGITLKSSSDRELADCAMLVAQRYTVVADEIIKDERLRNGGLAFEWTMNHDSRGALEALSRRELEVLKLVGTGRNNNEIAERLWLSSNTVRSHVQRLMRKLGLRNRLCLIIFAHELGLVNVEDVVLSSDDTEPSEPCSVRTGIGRGAAISGGASVVSHAVHAPDHGLQDRPR